MRLIYGPRKTRAAATSLLLGMLLACATGDRTFSAMLSGSPDNDTLTLAVTADTPFRIELFTRTPRGEARRSVSTEISNSPIALAVSMKPNIVSLGRLGSREEVLVLRINRGTIVSETPKLLRVGGAFVRGDMQWRIGRVTSSAGQPNQTGDLILRVVLAVG